MVEAAPRTPIVHNELTPRSRVGAIWISLAIFVGVLLLLMVFVLQNNKSVPINYLGAHSTISFGVAILLAAIAGSVLTLLVGTVRILQLKFMRNKKFTSEVAS